LYTVEGEPYGYFFGLFRDNKKFGRGKWMEKVEERLAGFGVLRIRIEITIECQKKKEDLRGEERAEL
jgi:hypothetical protein